MSKENAKRLSDFLQDEARTNLHSVIYYDSGEYELVYAHKELNKRYVEGDIEDIVKELGIQSLERSLKENAYHHGDLRCSVKWFDDGIELYIFLDEKEGIAVGFGPRRFVESRSFLWRCLEAAGLDSNDSSGR